MASLPNIFNRVRRNNRTRWLFHLTGMRRELWRKLLRVSYRRLKENLICTGRRRTDDLWLIRKLSIALLMSNRSGDTEFSRFSYQLGEILRCVVLEFVNKDTKLLSLISRSSSHRMEELTCHNN